MATKKTTKDKYNQVDYFASQTASMVYGGLSKDMTPAQKKSSLRQRKNSSGQLHGDRIQGR